MAFYSRWPPYVPVAQRRANANREVSRLAKKGQKLRPIQIKSRAIATSFWGLSWCENLEVYADWANRMPRGRAYARNGSIIDLQIEPGKIAALVNGSSLYKVEISIKPLSKKQWKAIRSDCSRQINSLLDLIRGKLPDAVLARLTDPERGMFPSPNELTLQCTCPDYAMVCKHIAATLYGVGHLLDLEPALFFKMRGVDQTELVSDAMATQACDDAIGLNQQSDFANEDLSAIFGIDLTTNSGVLDQEGKRRQSDSRRKRDQSTSKHATTPKSTAKPQGQVSRVSRSKIVAKKAKDDFNPTVVAPKREATFSKSVKAKKKTAHQKLLQQAPAKVVTLNKPKSKPVKKVATAQASIVGTHVKPAVASKKVSKAESAKKAKR